MKVCDLTLTNPEENLAYDEVLLDLGEAGELGPVLRFWEPVQYFVVLGYANRTSIEVNREFCQRNQIPVLRRCSGGGAVFQGPGCLNYSLTLPIANMAELHGIASTNDYVLKRNQSALQTLLGRPVQKQGHTDLTLGGLKFSGNSQRRKKWFVLFHGSFLLGADFELMEQVLPQPSHQPDYRLNRSHTEFLMNLDLPAASLKRALIECWQVKEPLAEIPFQRIEELAKQKYSQDSWNFKF